MEVTLKAEAGGDGVFSDVTHQPFFSADLRSEERHIAANVCFSDKTRPFVQTEPLI